MRNEMEEMKMIAEIESLTAPNYKRWCRERKEADFYYKEIAIRERKIKLVEITNLRQQIKELKKEITKPLPKRRPITKDEYNKYIEKCKEDAKEHGWKWIEPEEEVL